MPAEEEGEKTPEEVAVAREGDTEAEAEKGNKPRKLVKDDERQAKWSIYKTYLQASCVLHSSRVQDV